MDVFVLKALVDDLQQCLPGALVSKVFQLSPDDLLLRLWRHQDLRLLLSIQAQWQGLHLTTSRFHTPERPPRFAALLRAHLKQVRLQQITVQPYERIVSLTWERPGASAPALTLIHEVQGTQANIVLLDADGVILGTLKQGPAAATASRALLPGQRYTPRSVPSQRRLVSDLSVADLQHLQHQGCFAARHLQRLVVGLSPVLAHELIQRSQGDPQRCWETVQTLRQHYEAGTLSLFLCTTPDGTQHLTVLPLTTPATACMTLTSPQEAAAAFYQPTMVTAALDHMRQRVHKIIARRLQKLRKKMHNLTQDQHKLQGYLPYQHYGTLLLSQRLPRGATSAEVVDYYSAEPTTVRIALDPRLSVHDNAQMYFKKYRKTRSGLATIDQLLAQGRAEAHALEARLAAIHQAEDWQMLEDLAVDVQAGQPEGRQQAPVRPKTPAAVPYRTFTSCDGYTLYCGKSDQGNEALLRQVAAPEDWWLHAHQHAGSHVVVKVQPSAEVPHQTLLEAASLAAFYSKGREAATVEVLYTRVKHVHKFRRARPGQVQVQTYHTLTVAPRLPGA